MTKRRWNSSAKKPTENKIYERKYEVGVFFNKFEDGVWYDSATSINEAAKSVWISFAKLPWREIQQGA